jgi:hypothetical protein
MAREPSPLQNVIKVRLHLSKYLCNFLAFLAQHLAAVEQDMWVWPLLHL